MSDPHLFLTVLQNIKHEKDMDKVALTFVKGFAASLKLFDYVFKHIQNLEDRLGRLEQQRKNFQK